MRLGIPTFNFSIRNASSESVDIYIDGDIVDAETQEIFEKWFGDETSTSYKSFRDKLNNVDASTYNVYINSGGGLVTDAMAIHDLLKDIQNKGKKVNTIGRGIIASAATYILMAGKTPTMTKNSWFMIHNVSGVAWGDVNTVESYARTLRQFNDRSRDFYSEATGKSKDEITNMMNAETWMTADQAKEHGFIKQVEGEADFTQAIPKEKWMFNNTTVLNAYNSSVKAKPPVNDINEIITQNYNDMKKFFQDLANNILTAVKGVTAPENNDHASLMNSLGDAIKNVFDGCADQFEKAVNDAVSTGVANTLDLTKNEAFKTSLTDLVTNSVAESLKFDKEGPAKTALQAAVKTAVENATKDIEADITVLKGAKQSAKQEDSNTPAPIGKFS